MDTSNIKEMLVLGLIVLVALVIFEKGVKPLLDGSKGIVEA